MIKVDREEKTISFSKNSKGNFLDFAILVGFIFDKS